MVYVPHPSEREDGPRGVLNKLKGKKNEKKNENLQQLVVQPPGPLTIMPGAPIAAGASMVVMQPPPVEPGTVVIISQPSQQPAQQIVVQQQPIGDGKNAGKGGKDKEKEKKDEKSKTGAYKIEKHFGVCSCIMATLTGCVCLPCIYLCCPCDARTVYVEDGHRTKKANFSLSCGGCGCCCC